MIVRRRPLFGVRERILASALLLAVVTAACSDPPAPNPPTEASEPAAAAAPQPAAPVASQADRPPGADALDRVIAAEHATAFVGMKRSVFGPEGESRSTRMKVSRFPTGRTMLEWEGESGVRRRWSYQRRATNWLEHPDLILKNYKVTVDDAGRPVAWRPTRRITISGAREGRPSLELLVDTEKWIVLREEARDVEGHVWHQSEFESIEFREPEPTETATGNDTPPDWSGTQEGEESSVDPPLTATTVPEGFVRLRRVVTRHGGRREDWSDGLAAFSIWERTAGDAPRVGPPLKEGEVQRRQCRGRASVSGVFGGIEVIVMGNLAASELEKVVRGLAAPAPGR